MYIHSREKEREREQKRDGGAVYIRKIFRPERVTGRRRRLQRLLIERCQANIYHFAFSTGKNCILHMYNRYTVKTKCKSNVKRILMPAR